MVTTATADTLEGVNVHVRGVDEDVWEEMRVRAIREKRPVGELVNDAFRLYLETAKDTPTDAPRP